MTDQLKLSCRCGKTTLAVQGRPILSVECLCNSCRQAGDVLQQRPGAPVIVDAKGATPFVLYRKDRVQCLQGADQLREHRIKDDSKTRRVVTQCCNTPMFLEFTQGHWLSLYGELWPSDQLPALDLRTMVGDLPDQGAALPKDVPNLKTHSARFFVRLLGAWLAMGLRTPRLDYVSGTLDPK